jgi:hypothetical protein
MSTLGQNAINLDLLPSWIFRLPISKYASHLSIFFSNLMSSESLRSIGQAYKDFESFMLTKIISTKADLETRTATYSEPTRRDLLTRLITASQNGSTESTLTDREILGNIYGFLAAGHGGIPSSSVYVGRLILGIRDDSSNDGDGTRTSSRISRGSAEGVQIRGCRHL